jgi:hypothetical protein
MPQFLELMTTCLNTDTKWPKILKYHLIMLMIPQISQMIYKQGDIDKSGYLDLAGRIQSYINTNGRDPNYGSSSSGKVGYPQWFYMYSRLLVITMITTFFPNYASVQLLNGTTSQHQV